MRCILIALTYLKDGPSVTDSNVVSSNASGLQKMLPESSLQEVSSGESEVSIPPLVEIPFDILLLAIHRPWIASPKIMHPLLHSVDFIDAPVKFQV
jgi:hypothetical protein